MSSFDSGQRAVLERIAGGAPLSDVLDGIVRLIEGQADGMLCSILLLDGERGVVRHGAAPSLPAGYIRALDGAPIGPNAGSCGTAAFRRETVVVEDVATHPLWADYRDLALEHGLRACWSSPIFSSTRDVLGTFAMYYRAARGPSDAERGWVDVATHLAAIAIIRDRTEQSLRRSEARATQLARLYAVSSRVNEAIVRERSPRSLYELACRIAVEEGLARLAWIGLYDGETDRIRAAARFGADDGYVDTVTLRVADEQRGVGPAARAMREGAPALSNDLEHDPEFLWKSEALARGLRSCAVFPLRVAGQKTGIFALYADRPHSFQSEEVKVLSALADDISFGIESAANVSALRASEERLRAVIEHTPNVAIQWYDRAGRILFYNHATQVLFGWTANGALGKTLVEVGFFSPSEEERFAVARANAAAGRSIEPVEFEYRRADGTTGFLISTVFQIPVGVDQSAFVCMDVDVTEGRRVEAERRHLEAQLQKGQRLQSLGSLAGGIAHDFNNIVVGIAGHAEAALESLSHDTPGRKSLLEIRTASRRAGELVRRIYDFSRPEGSKWETISLRDVVEEAVALLRATLPPHVDLRTSFADGTPLILADSTLIHRVVMNLGTNAVHALGAKGGVLEITVDDFVFEPSSTFAGPDLHRGRYARLRVKDGGCGIDARTLEKIWDPFFTTKPKGEGTGLGLSVVHGVAKSHRGAATVESELGVGTTFHVHFPAAPTAAPVTHAPKAGSHILYVDDEESLVFLATRLLERIGYRVTGHASSTRALEAFQAEPNAFDAVVTDISMPGLTGPELVKQIRRTRPDLPVVMTTGFIREEDERSAEHLGIAHLVLKPHSIDSLATLIAQLVSK